MVKICEVVDGCEECPRYADDCDGRGDAEMLNEDFRPKYMQQSRHDDGKDLISRADAIEAVASITMSIHLSDVICDKLLALPSADTEPKRVLQGYCKGANTIKTIRHEELTQIANTRKAVESADAVHGWIPCSDRLPSESGTYLVTTAKGAVWADHFYANSVDDRHWSYRTRRVPIAWMPMPKPYKGGDTE